MAVFANYNKKAMRQIYLSYKEQIITHCKGSAYELPVPQKPSDLSVQYEGGNYYLLRNFPGGNIRLFVIDDSLMPREGWERIG